jgi:outer membrane protein OmpA-like peptidoglycan-associated protein
MSLAKLFPPRPSHAREDHWIPLSDLMTGLMMVFMLVAIVFMIKVEGESHRTEALKRQAQEQAEKMKRVAVLYDQTREQIFDDLLREFQPDLAEWRAVLDRNLAFRFEEPKVLFDSGRTDIKPEFKKILDDFFPRYVGVIEKYRDSIDEIRIEGHTSSIWLNTTGDEAYFKNMELSQGRTRSTLKYVLLEPAVSDSKGWLTKKLTANGLSSSKVRTNADGSENVLASQRVEFRIRTNADARIEEILKASQK